MPRLPGTFLRTVLPSRSAAGCGLLAAALLIAGCQTPAPVESEPASPPPPPPPIQSEPDPTPEPPPPPEVEPSPRPRAPRNAIRNQARRLGAEITESEDGKRVTLRKGETELVLAMDSRKALLNGVAVHLDEPFAKRDQGAALSRSDFDLLAKPAFLGLEGRLPSNLIVIDPGHGGSETGAASASQGLVEKELTLDVSLRLRDKLEELGYKVAMTRYDDRLVHLSERARIANRAGAGLFVSLHFNGAPNKDAVGLETFALTPEGRASTSDADPPDDAEAYPGNRYNEFNLRLAIELQSGLNQDLQRFDRGVKKARFVVLKEIQCPGALVECGFLTNSEEALLVGTPVYREKLAKSLARAIDAFMKRYGPPPAAD